MTGRLGLIDTAAIIAVLASGLYLIGSIYLVSFYGRLGLADTQLRFDVPFTMSKSLLPLLLPVGYLILAAFLFSGLPPWRDAPQAWLPFHPLPASKVVAVVTVTWAVKLFADHQFPSAGVQWLAWDRRDVLFLLAGTAVLTALYLSFFVHRALKEKPVVTNQTTAFGWIFGVMILFVVLMSILQRQWLLSAWGTIAVVLGVAWLGWLVWRDLKTWPERKVNHRSSFDPPEERIARSRGSTMMLYTVSALALLVAVGLQGSLEAGEAQEGCEAVNTISFNPPLHDTETNRTYWLVLHHEGVYYMRDLPPDSGDVTVAIPEEPGRAASIGRQQALENC